MLMCCVPNRRADKVPLSCNRPMRTARSTLETLAAIKNPPVVFARQANVAHGPQQVNNGVPLERSQQSNTPPAGHAHGKTQNQANELLGDTDGSRLDAGAQATAGFANPKLAAVGAIDRPEVSRRARQGCAKQL